MAETQLVQNDQERQAIKEEFCTNGWVADLTVVMNLLNLHIFSSPEPKAQRWAYSIPVKPASVRASVHTFKHEYLCNQLADWNEILSEASLGGGGGRLQ